MWRLSHTHRGTFSPLFHKCIISSKLAYNNQSLLLLLSSDKGCIGNEKWRDITAYSRSTCIIATRFHFNFSVTSRFSVHPCPAQQSWPRCQLCFRAKMCFKSCCRMVMFCATCQPMSIPRQMGEAVVKKQPSLGLSQGVIYHIKAWHNRGLSYGICFPKDSMFFFFLGGGTPITWCQWNLKTSFSQLTFKIKKHLHSSVKHIRRLQICLTLMLQLSYNNSSRKILAGNGLFKKNKNKNKLTPWSEISTCSLLENSFILAICYVK